MPWATISSAALSTSRPGEPVITGELAWSPARSETSRPSASTLTVRSRSVTKAAGAPRSSTSTTEPTFRSRISAATSSTGADSGAVTTDSVMTSRISIAARVYYA